MCGDHGYGIQKSITMMGSPPHVRGPLLIAKHFKRRGGITPACAGTTISNLCSCIVHRDHPRMCGDHVKTFYRVQVGAGSPPHVRGPRLSDSEGVVRLGITPACAGTTDESDAVTVEDRSPHVRGPRRRTTAQLNQSDHRMCGDHKYSKVRRPADHPACAGTTVWTIAVGVIFWDHPRMCGDHGICRL